MTVSSDDLSGEFETYSNQIQIIIIQSVHVWKHLNSVSDNVQFPQYVIKCHIRVLFLWSGWCDNWMQSWVTDQFHFIWKDLCVLSSPEYERLNALIGCCMVITFSSFNSIFLVPWISALFRWVSVISAQCVSDQDCVVTQAAVAIKSETVIIWEALTLIKSSVSVFSEQERVMIAAIGRLIYWTLYEMKNVACCPAANRLYFTWKSLTGYRATRLQQRQCNCCFEMWKNAESISLLLSTSFIHF